VDFVTVTGFRGFREFRFLGRPKLPFTPHHVYYVTNVFDKYSEQP